MNRAAVRRRSAVRSRRAFAPGIESCEKVCLLTAGVSLAGHAFVDVDASGSRDPGEAGAAGAVITLFDADVIDVLGVAVTGGDGAYRFDDSTVDSGNLPAGSYVLLVTAPEGLTPNNPGGYPDVLFAVTSASDLDFALRPPAAAPNTSISGQVYADLTGDGQFNTGDTPAVGEQIRLSGIDGRGASVSEIAVTDARGTFHFSTLQPGTYTITNLQTLTGLAGQNTAGVVSHLNGDGGASGTLSGLDSIAGITLAAGDTASGFQFGEAENVIAGRAFRDAEGNGLDLATDAPMGGVKIKLYRDDNGNGKLDPDETSLVATTTTASGTGAYRFLNPGKGAFIAREDVPAGYARTAPLLSDDIPVTIGPGGIAHDGLNFANYAKPDLAAIQEIKYVVTHRNRSTTVADLRGRTKPGDTVRVTFTVKPGQAAEVSLVSYVAPGPAFDASTASLQRVFRDKTGGFGPGTYSLAVLIPNSYYQVAFVAGKAIERFGPAGSNLFHAEQGRLYSADEGGCRAAGTSSLSGSVYVDVNHDGKRQGREPGIAGVIVELIGTDYLGNRVDLRATTNREGVYRFSDLMASDEDGYTIRERPGPALASYGDGKESAESLGAAVSDDEFGGIILNVNAKGRRYRFGELRL